MDDSVLSFREFQSFEVRFVENCQGVALVLFYRSLEVVPVGIPLMLGIFPVVFAGSWVNIKSEIRNKYEIIISNDILEPRLYNFGSAISFVITF